MRRLWYAARYLPVVLLGLVAVAAAAIPGWLAVVLMLSLPAAVWLGYAILAARAMVGIGVSAPWAAHAANWRKAWSTRVLRGMWLIPMAFAIERVGAWMGPAMVAGVVAAVVIGASGKSSRVAGESLVGLGDLPAAAQRCFEGRPDLRVWRYPDRSSRHIAFARPGGVWISESVMTGDADELSGVIAHEVAHHRIGLSGIRIVVGLTAAGAAMIGWFVLVTMGRASASVSVGADGWGSAQGITAALFGLVLGMALLEPLALWLSRRRETAADRLAAEMLGTGRGLASLFQRHVRGARLDPWPPPLYYALQSTHPRAAQRIAAAESYAPHLGTRWSSPEPSRFALVRRRSASVVSRFQWWIAVGVVATLIVIAATIGSTPGISQPNSAMPDYARSFMDNVGFPVRLPQVPSEYTYEVSGDETSPETNVFVTWKTPGGAEFDLTESPSPFPAAPDGGTTVHTANGLSWQTAGEGEWVTSYPGGPYVRIQAPQKQLPIIAAGFPRPSD
jgi:Zn-dependent protease with chaperone function